MSSSSDLYNRNRAQRYGKDSSSAITEKVFRSETVSVEQTILKVIDLIESSAVMVKDVGDATQANNVFSALVLNLDNFVFPLLTSEEYIDWTDYMQERNKIIRKWDERVEGKKPVIDVARELYMLTIKVLAQQRLFTIKRSMYFGIGMKMGQQLPLSKIFLGEVGIDDDIKEVFSVKSEDDKEEGSKDENVVSESKSDEDDASGTSNGDDDEKRE